MRGSLLPSPWETGGRTWRQPASQQSTPHGVAIWREAQPLQWQGKRKDLTMLISLWQRTSPCTFLKGVFPGSTSFHDERGDLNNSQQLFLLWKQNICRRCWKEKLSGTCTCQLPTGQWRTLPVSCQIIRRTLRQQMVRYIPGWTPSMRQTGLSRPYPASWRWDPASVGKELGEGSSLVSTYVVGCSGRARQMFLSSFSVNSQALVGLSAQHVRKYHFFRCLNIDVRT